MGLLQLAIPTQEHISLCRVKRKHVCWGSTPCILLYVEPANRGVIQEMGVFIVLSIMGYSFRPPILRKPEKMNSVEQANFMEVCGTVASWNAYGTQTFLLKMQRLNIYKKDRRMQGSEQVIRARGGKLIWPKLPQSSRSCKSQSRKKMWNCSCYPID